MKNKITSIGFLGVKKCYLNVTEEEAIRRYNKSENVELGGDVSIDVIEFDDEFECYDIWEV